MWPYWLYCSPLLPNFRNQQSLHGTEAHLCFVLLLAVPDYHETICLRRNVKGTVTHLVTDTCSTHVNATEWSWANVDDAVLAGLVRIQVKSRKP